MNDRAVSILEQYDFVVERTWKGRGSILFETKEGIFILKEYKGTLQRLSFIAEALKRIRGNGYPDIEEIIPNKEGENACIDFDGATYIVKSYFNAKECNIKEKAECQKSIRALARLHKAMEGAAENSLLAPKQLPLLWEIEKHNAELHRVRRYLKEKGQKSEFELFLQHHYDFFQERAVSVTEKLYQEDLDGWLSSILHDNTMCHGDYQYHNILIEPEHCNIINFEKISVDNPVKDVYLFVRKLLEKNNWDVSLGKELLSTYAEERTLREEDFLQLKYRFSYPEKFWKIVNFYYNSPKAWISSKNGEKLQKLLEQETAKNRLIQELFEKYW